MLSSLTLIYSRFAMADLCDDYALSSHCYVCGPENPVGLHVTFVRDGDSGCRADYVARPEHAGWPGILHGGLLFTLMDEALAYSLRFAGLYGVTGRAEARFREPVTVGTPLVITARFETPPRRIVRARSEIRRAADGVLVSELDGAMVRTDVRQWATQG
jgi:acyl-coenzyme A thioesterase PaaI-like protein